MAETPNLGLPLIASAQTQKHITLNESLWLVDALLQGTLSQIDQTTPPASPAPGEIFAIGVGATGDWASQDGNLAIWTEGGWRYVQPKDGWTLYSGTDFQQLRYLAGIWRPISAAYSLAGASTELATLSVDHVIDPGAQSVTSALIPSHAHVIGVSGRVLSDVTSDTGTTWRLGVSGSDDRYGTGYGFASGSYAKGLTGSGLTYYADTALQLTCDGGNFTGGTVRLAVHFIEITVPE